MSRKSKPIAFTLASADSPAMSTGVDDKERQHLTPSEFGQQLSVLANETKELVKIARKVGALKSGQQLQLSTGAMIGAKELNKMVTEHNKTLKQLKKNYTARGSRKKRSALTKAGAVRKTGDGFGKGSFLRPELLAFVSNANFGAVNGPAGGTPVRDVIAPLLESGLLSRSILTVLFTIYEFANGLRFERDGKKYFQAGPQMSQYLGSYLSQLEAADRAKSDAEMLDKNDKPKPRFDRNQFVYNRLQSIAQPGLVATDELDAERRAYIENPQVKSTLKDIQETLSKTLKQWNPSK